MSSSVERARSESAPIRVGINGFGRIGRNFFRVNLSKGSPLDIVAVNDLTSSQQLANLLKLDSVYRTLDNSVTADGDGIIVDGKRLAVLSEKDPTNLPWGRLAVDVVIESTGRFTRSSAAAAHLEAGARKVIVSAPSSGDDVATIVMGINEASYDSSKYDIISNASCTTNCLAPLAMVFNDRFGIESGLMTTTHAYTADQNLQDGPHPDDPRRARAAALNIVPSSTGAARAIGLVLPELDGRLDGGALRVPTPVGSLTELTVVPSTSGIQVKDINDGYKEAASGLLHGILDYSEDPLVSGDIVTSPFSAIYDSGLTRVFHDQARVAAWYDNEWGFSNRLVELATYVGAQLSAA